ncbi:undecaprenyldiphospho-muramoylpentapeptide beta-N-acetylglucosaminyltransferase [Acidithiobacillus sp.]|jgi:UDP-N-acetylglucosamine--N-acetylmuramyl-(pentapeptide) pyrophosphoryl-undecaprenol N-acetylglucosamine transferase|uniref:undecaprenyldiphospho-muramoylpentapeptide beta-N-acetylglucosaminyltransferase n=1 Tax=Acidithiobacillus sp. TaxID=1872118 RepID=UPI003D05A3E0
MADSVLIAAGGTGGHVFPALAVADALRAQGVEVTFAGTATGMEARLVPERGYTLHTLDMQGLRGKGFRRWLRAPWRVSRAILQARRILRQTRSRVVLGMGGYVTAPVGIAAWTLGRPLCLHEQNAVAGLSNRLLAPLARRVFLGFPGARLARGEWVGNPVREAIHALPTPQERFHDRKGPVRLLIMGGSQGAKVLNAVSAAALSGMTDAERPAIWHQTGRDHAESTRAAYAQAGIDARVEPFIDDMAAALDWADLALCRAGAATIAELAAAGLGAILIPFPFAVDDHQAANARFLEKAGAARMLRQEGLDALQLRDVLRPLLADPGLRLRWAEAARRQAKGDAAATVAAACIECAGGTDA